MAKEVNIRKVAVVGCGFVGSTSAYTLMQSSLFSEMVLIDADKARAEGEALDIKHGLPFAKPMNIYAQEPRRPRPQEGRPDRLADQLRAFGRSQA